VAPADGGVEHLAERLGDPVSGSGRQLGLPAGDLVGHPLKVRQGFVAERRDGVAEPIAQRGDGAGTDGGRVAFEVNLDQLGERQRRRDT
jgi:hypothetical protein